MGIIYVIQVMTCVMVDLADSGAMKATRFKECPGLGVKEARDLLGDGQGGH